MTLCVRLSALVMCIPDSSFMTVCGLWIPVVSAFGVLSLALGLISVRLMVLVWVILAVSVRGLLVIMVPS